MHRVAARLDAAVQRCRASSAPGWREADQSSGTGDFVACATEERLADAKAARATLYRLPDGTIAQFFVERA